MGFEESAFVRLRRYHDEVQRSLGLIREAEEAARGFSERLFAGLEYAAILGRRAGLRLETTRADCVLDLRIVEGSEASASFALVRGAAAETDEDLMHEELSRYSLDPSGYSGRILSWSGVVGEEPCQTFAVYRDGVWKTKGLFVAKARGKTDDPDEVLGGFCLRILGRLVDLAATTGGVGRRWAGGAYTLSDHLEGKAFPTETRLPR